MSAFEHVTVIEGHGGERPVNLLSRWVCSCSDRGEWMLGARAVRHAAGEHRFLATKRDAWSEAVRVILVEEGSICEHTGDDGPTINVDVNHVAEIIAARLIERWDQGL